MARKHSLAVVLFLVALVCGNLALSGKEIDLLAWPRVQAAVLGIALRLPPGAAVELHAEAGLLRAVLPGEQVLLLRTFDNPQQLAVETWAASTFLDASRRGQDPLALMFPVSDLKSGEIGGNPAVQFDIYGPVFSTRRAVFGAGSRVWVLDFPFT